MRTTTKNRDRFDLNYFEDRPMKVRGCDHPGCSSSGDYRAPKTRELNDYFWFCLDHVRAYNKAWDYFAGMPSAAIEAHIRSSTVWDRPTWPLGEWQKREQELRDTLDKDFFGGTGEFYTRPEPASAAMSVAERDALALLEMVPPVSFAAIKAQYRVMVKRHHPDTNGGTRESEELFKNINHAFTILKQIYASEDGEG